MIKVVFKNGIVVEIPYARGINEPNGDSHNWDYDIDATCDDYLNISIDEEIVFCGRWSEILYFMEE